MAYALTSFWPINFETYSFQVHIINQYVISDRIRSILGILQKMNSELSRTVFWLYTPKYLFQRQFILILSINAIFLIERNLTWLYLKDISLMFGSIRGAFWTITWEITRNHIITSCIKGKRIATNLTNPYFTLATFETCFFSQFSSFNDEKIYVTRITISKW